jgi:hypothetical protein
VQVLVLASRAPCIPHVCGDDDGAHVHDHDWVELVLRAHAVSAALYHVWTAHDYHDGLHCDVEHDDPRAWLWTSYVCYHDALLVFYSLPGVSES